VAKGNPKNWRLPRSDNPGSSPGGNNNRNEFWNLNQSQNNGLTNTDSGLRTNWLGVRAGIVSNAGVLNDVGAWGFYWSSTVSNAATARLLNFNATSVNPAGGSNKSGGFSVRCVLD